MLKTAEQKPFGHEFTRMNTNEHESKRRLKCGCSTMNRKMTFRNVSKPFQPQSHPSQRTRRMGHPFTCTPLFVNQSVLRTVTVEGAGRPLKACVTLFFSITYALKEHAPFKRICRVSGPADNRKTDCR